tara:strand:+ start:4639 stop:5919 length:1281 start_codon:yes stop_codon:yes gene_type:complete
LKKKKLKILFHPNTTQWLDFYYLAKKLSKNHDIYFIIWNEDLLKLINQYNNKFKVIVYKNPTFWKISKYINQIKKRSFLKKIILNLKDYFFIKKLFAKKKFDILISNSDRDTSIVLNLCYQAKKDKIPIILNCNFRCVDLKSLIYRRINIKKYNLRKFSLIVKVFKEQYKNYRNKFVSFFYEVDMIIFYFLNILPKNPWIIGGGNSDFVFVENEDIKNYYIKLGCNKKKIICTGSTKTDNFLQNNNSNIYKNLKVQNKTKIIILLLSQFLEHGDIGENEQKNRVSSICEFMTNLTKGKKIKIIISLHPKQKYQNYRWVEKKYKFQISKKELSKIINISDLIVSEAPSSIADWAKILKIPYIVISKEKHLTSDQKLFEYHHVQTYKKASQKINYFLNKKKYKSENKKLKIKSLEIKTLFVEQDKISF